MRIDISYGGEWYTVGDRTPEQLHTEVRAGLATGHHWLVVNDGDSSVRKAYLSISPGVALAIVPVPVEEPAADEPGDRDGGPVWTGPTIEDARRRRAEGS